MFRLSVLPRSFVLWIESEDHAVAELQRPSRALTSAEVRDTARDLAQGRAFLIAEDALWHDGPRSVELRSSLRFVDRGGRSRFLLPRSRVISIRDEDQARGLLADANRELSGRQLDAMAEDVASGSALLVIAHDFEEVDFAAATRDDEIVPFPPEPLPPAPEPETWFELCVVDELGQPLAELPITFLVDGATVQRLTDSEGRARVELKGAASFASATVTELDVVRDLLTERWTQIRTGDSLEPADDRTFTTCALVAGERPRAQLTAAVPHTLVFYPDVVLIRFLGMYFDMAKSFLLHCGDLREIRALYEACPNANLLIVGHADALGSASSNDALGLQRARSVAAYLRDDVEAWLNHYTSALPSEQRWGSIEDYHMLDAVLARDPEAPEYDRARYYQESHGLHVDGRIGTETRTCLIADYMALDAVALPPTTDVEIHSCGELFPYEPDGDVPTLGPIAEVCDRRVELFFFRDGLGTLPSAPQAVSAIGAPEYPQWRRRASQTHEYAQLPARRVFCFSA